MNKHQFLLALGMLVTGSINTIANKVADWQSAEGVHNGNCPRWADASSGDYTPGPCQFIHPFFQALIMFIGESTCLVVYYGGRYIDRKRGKEVPEAVPFNKFIFMLPACCDSEDARSISRMPN